jgi:signal transduction histidine kinase
MRATSSHSLVGKTDFDFYPLAVAQQYRKMEEEVIADGRPRRFDQAYIQSDGEEGWLSTLKAPMRDENGRIIGLITHNRDITQEKRAISAKEDFISTVSHELRTPLTSIRGAVGLLAGGAAGELPPKAASLVKMAHLNSERLVTLINDILDIERLSSGKLDLVLRTIPIVPLIDDAVAASTNYLAEKHTDTFITNLAAGALANLDGARFRQVLDNLLSNAIKYSPSCSRIEVKIARTGTGWLRVSVIDQGAGIPAEFKNRIFGRFERADASNTREIGGTGLGLNIAKEIVEQHGGRIGFQDGDGWGTEFFVEFEEALDAGVIERNSREKDPSARVLYVEDDPGLIRLAVDGLDSSISLVCAPTLAAAKIALASTRFDVVVIDIYLADGSGLELFPFIYFDTKIVIYSSAEVHMSEIPRPVEGAFVKTKISEARVLERVGEIALGNSRKLESKTG